MAFTTAGPIEMLGTKWPSMTSTCTQSHPALSIARTSSPSLAKSADRIDGAMMMSVVMAFSFALPPLPILFDGERVGVRGSRTPQRQFLPLTLTLSP